MPPLYSDEESDGSIGAVTTPPPFKRNKKISSYASTNSADEDDEISGIDTTKASKSTRARTSTAQKNGTSSSAAAKGKGKAAAKPDNGKIDDNGDVGEDDGEGLDEDEYEVEKIIGHLIGDNGEPLFRVMWKGYPNQSDHTWEPEENLIENASEILSDYIAKIGGHAKLFETPSKGKKRGRQSAGTSAGTPTAAAKRAKKVGEKASVEPEEDDHPAARESPSAATELFVPPPGSWEDLVVGVDMFRGNDGQLRVYLTWKNGQKTHHLSKQVYTRCPQKMLEFYESRINFKPSSS